MPMDERKRRVLIESTLSIHDTIQNIDQSDLAIALVTDADGRLIGTVTDGDIRRAILRGVDLNARVTEVMNPNPWTVSPTTDTQDLRRIFLESTVKHIPVVDEAGKVVDLVLSTELLSVPLSNPDITEREVEAVLQVLNTTHLSLGPKVVEFEQKLARYVGRKHAIAVSSGTAGLHVVVKALGIGPGDEVITTPFSFIASSNCAMYVGAKPVFVDIDPETYNIDPDRLEAAITPRTRAILPVDVFGQPARYDVIEEIARRRGLHVISDCCESIGATYRGRMAGSFGTAGVFAFYPNKQITTGEGGIVVTDDDEVASICRSLRNQGRSEKGGWLSHERLGYNYRLPEISCALGIVQLDRIEEILQRRQSVADAYAELLGDLESFHLPSIHPGVTRMSWFVYVVRLHERYGRTERDRIILKLSLDGIGANSYFQPIHLQPFYREQFGYKEGDFPVTEAVARRTIALPFHNRLGRDEARTVAARLRSALEEIHAASPVRPG